MEITLLQLNSTFPFPRISEPEQTDVWPSQKVAAQFYKTVAAIIDRGFTGLKLSWSELPSGRLYTNYKYDKNSPEGRMLEALVYLAKNGHQLPPDVIVILERIYREQDRRLPKARRKS